ncbi:phage baseplate protein [Enterobacter mori]
MAYGLPGYNISPMGYSGKDGILFHLEDDMSVFLKLSATQSMQYQSQMNVSQHPVMSGANVADNQSRAPKQITISGVVVAGYEGAFFLTHNSSTVEDFIATAERWRDNKQLCRVICKDGISLEHAVIQNLTATKNKEISNGLNIEMTFIGIDIVKPATKTKVNTGGKGTGNSNGSPAGTKTKTGAVQGKKPAGNQPTKITQSADACNDLRSREDFGSDKGLQSMGYDCDMHQSVNKGQVTHGAAVNRQAREYLRTHPMLAKGNNPAQAQGTSK